jgi:hypothetical protein
MTTLRFAPLIGKKIVNGEQILDVFVEAGMPEGHVIVSNSLYLIERAFLKLTDLHRHSRILVTNDPIRMVCVSVASHSHLTVPR